MLAMEPRSAAGRLPAADLHVELRSELRVTRHLLKHHSCDGIGKRQ